MKHDIVEAHYSHDVDLQEVLAQLPDFSSLPEHQTNDPLADYGKIESIFGRYAPEYEVYFPDSSPPVPIRDPHTRERVGQGTLELVYHRLGNIITNPIDDNAQPDDREIAWRLDLDHVVKNAPHLVNQVVETDRKNIVEFVGGVKKGLGTKANEYVHDNERSLVRMSEADALKQLWEFLTVAVHDTEVSTILRQRLENIRELVTFVGEKELNEAAEGLAIYWKNRMDKNPRKPLVILPIDQAISPEGFNGDGAMTKSSTYLLDKILSYFSETDIQKYRKQLRFGFDGMGRWAMNNSRVIILDDWSLSGKQLKGARNRLVEQYSQVGLGGIEINLVAASQELIHTGLDGDGNGSTTTWPGGTRTPVRAYFMTKSPAKFMQNNRGGFVTGVHSSADYAFEDAIQAIVARHANDDPPTILSTMPPLTNIVRPYRQEGYFPNNIARVLGT